MPVPRPDDVFAKIFALQMMDDAITYRQSILATPCTDCTPAQSCLDHADDERLIAGYREQYNEVLQYLLTDIDPDLIARFMPPSGDTLPTAEAIALLARAAFLDLAAIGPMTGPDGCTYVVVAEEWSEVAKRTTRPGIVNSGTGQCAARQDCIVADTPRT